MRKIAKISLGSWKNFGCTGSYEGAIVYFSDLQMYVPFLRYIAISEPGEIIRIRWLDYNGKCFRYSLFKDHFLMRSRWMHVLNAAERLMTVKR